MDQVILRTMFRRMEFPDSFVRLADSIASAAQILTNFIPDVVLLDMFLPDSHGVATVSALREICPNAPIVVLTASEQEETAMQAVRRGAQDYFVKGTVDAPMLVRALRHAIERRRLESQVLRMQKLEAIRRLAGGVAHDFNNQLMVIRGHAEIMEMRLNAQDPLQENARQVLSAADHAAQLIQQLLAFSQQQVAQKTVLDLNAAIRKSEGMVHRLAGKNVEVSLDLAIDSLPVHADQGQILEVLINLVTNARDAMPHGGSLLIRTSQTSVTTEDTESPEDADPCGYACLEISDTGIGMDQKTVERAFEPFFTTKEFGQGAGLGLASVHGIVHQNAGRIYVSSEPNFGTKFKILLPVFAGSKEPASSTEALGIHTSPATHLA